MAQTQFESQQAQHDPDTVLSLSRHSMAQTQAFRAAQSWQAISRLIKATVHQPEGEDNLLLLLGNSTKSVLAEGQK